MGHVVSDKPITCPICGETVLSYESHHIVPISLNGPKNGRQINLCDSCHNNIHLTAKARLAKSEKAQQRQYFTDLKQLERANPLIDVIVKAALAYENVQSSKRRRRIYILDVSDVTHARLQKLKADKGYTNLTNFLNDMFEAIADGRIKL